MEQSQNAKEESGLFDDIFAMEPVAPRTASPEERLIAAATTSNPIEAGFIVRLLEHRGIAATVEGQPRPTDYQPVKLRVMIWSADEAAATELLAELDRRQQARQAERAAAGDS
jgi:hypothetical protein